jgi:hypothetical protein
MLPYLPSRWSFALGLAAITLGSLILVRSPSAIAQQADSGAENGPMPMQTPAPDQSNDRLPPIAKIPMRQPITGSMMVSPPYGSAPLKVGFFVLADDPENIGFLTYSWNFGDGTVSSLPPELYIFHTYQNPGNYICSLQIRTIDGREKTFFQGVIVKPAAG